MSIAALQLPLPGLPQPLSRSRPVGRRLGDRRREPPTPRRSLVVDNGCDVRIGHVRLEPSVVLALLEWLPLAHADIAAIEDHGPTDPVAALGTVLRPPTIWSAVEALSARGHARDGADLTRYAAGRVTALHVARVRREGARIAAQLPLRGLPRASSVVASGCAAVMADAGACADAAANQLVRYATSDLIQL